MGRALRQGDSTPLSTPTEACDYLFHLDALPERLTFYSRLKMTGWLLHRAGMPISGLRAVLKPRGRSARTYKGRRKRARPALGAAYPHLPDAGMSGFLVEIDDLPLGTYDLTLDVRDQEKAWHTLFRTTASAVPLGIVRRLRFPQLEETLRSKLQRHFPKTTPNLALAAGEAEEIRREIARSLRVDPLPPRLIPVAKVNLFVTAKSNLFIREIGELVCAGFREAGCESQLLIDQFPEAETDPDTLQIVVTPHEFYNLFLTPALPEDEIRRRSQNCFLLGTEQPDSDWFHSNLVVAPQARAMLDINLLGVAGYRACGLRCFHLPLGFHPILRGNHNLPGVIRDLDICLLASITERREKFLAAHAEFFAQRRCHLRLVPLSFAKTETTKSYLPVAARNEILQQSKILLNVHYSELRYFEWHRMLVGLANGCCIVTETCEGFAPLVPGEHFIMVETENLISTCEYYLSHPEEREKIAHAGREFVEKHLTQGDNCLELLEQISSGQPRSLGERAEDRISTPPTPRCGGGRYPLWRAFSRDLANWFTPPERMPVTSPEDDAKAVATIRERRRGYEGRFKQQETLRQAEGDVWQIQENESFRQTKAPAVTILITLYNYENYISDCITSVANAETGSIEGGIEVLIVNDASTDRSLARAAELQRSSSLPIRIVDKKFNTGLADARNVGLQLARAPYVFIMDADNLIYPHALGSLFQAIQSSGAAAAYSILRRFIKRPGNHQGLLSYFDWDPRMLVEHPYIDAMALFDRRRLIELGGYDNNLYQIGWFGWEDYELWLRMAAAHLQAVFVPNILCLYRHHESAMSRTTNLFEVELVRHLLAKYQWLIEEYQPKERVFGVEWARLE